MTGSFPASKAADGFSKITTGRLFHVRFAMMTGHITAPAPHRSPVMGKVRLTDALLKRAHQAAIRHSALNQKMTHAFEQRYGCTYSEVDCDWIIDGLDYGTGPTLTVAMCDVAMAECGRKVLTAKDSPHGQ
jgi:hypothetical protein